MVLVQMHRREWILSRSHPTLWGNVYWVRTVVSPEPESGRGLVVQTWLPRGVHIRRGIARKNFSEFGPEQMLLRTVRVGV